MNDNTKIGADINAGDGGYSEGTKEKYDEFVKGRNQSLSKMRIKQLALQAGMVKILDEHASEYGAGTFENTPYPELKKFTKLIVTEVLAVQEQLIADGHNAWHLNKSTKEYFGIEEC